VNIGPMEILIVLVLALLVFGPKRLPQAGRSLGQAIRELKKATSTARSELGIDDVAADVRDLKSSISIDMKAADQPAPAKSSDDAVTSAIDVLPAAGATASAGDVPKEADEMLADAAEVETAEALEATADATDTAAEAEADEADAPEGPEAPPEPSVSTTTSPPGDA
jgi:TatA/E family protein of Tat protein translocase